MALGGGWVIELDIQSFFDELDRQQLRGILHQRIRDGVITRLIDKGLKAGVFEDGQLSHPQHGTPQGGVISPRLANSYLHEVLDRWCEECVKPRLKGRGFLVRYADDALLCFSKESDAARVMDVLPKRFARYGLRLQPTKTQRVRFKPPCHSDSGGVSRSFDLLGFTHCRGRSRRGRWVIQQHTAKLRGPYAYHGISGNSRQLRCMRYRVERLWIKWLGRRSQRARIRWKHAGRLLERYALPPARLRRARVT